MNRGVSASADELFLAAQQPGGDPTRTGRYIITLKPDGAGGGMKTFQAQGLRIANAAEFEGQAVVLEETGDADALFFPEIGVVLMGGEAAESRGLTPAAALAADSPIQAIEPEHFVYTQAVKAADYLKGVLHTAQTIYDDLAGQTVEPAVFGVTPGLEACKVPPSAFSGRRLAIAAIDDGFDKTHPDFAGRSITDASFSATPGKMIHGTHIIGTAAGPKAPAGKVPRYGIAYEAAIFAANVFNAWGGSTTAMVLAGMNWAIANHCVAINISLGAPVPPQASYTAAGNAAMQKRCLIIAAAGDHTPPAPAIVLAPANSPSIVSVAAVYNNGHPAGWSNRGKIDIAAPGVEILSAYPGSPYHKYMNGTSSAAAHVTGCAALWAQSNPTLRGAALRAKLFATAKPLPFPPADVGAGLVQAP